MILMVPCHILGRYRHYLLQQTYFWQKISGRDATFQRNFASLHRERCQDRLRQYWGCTGFDGK